MLLACRPVPRALMAVLVFFQVLNLILAYWSWVASSSFGVFVLGTRSSPLRFMPTSVLLRLAGLIGFLGNSTILDAVFRGVLSPPPPWGVGFPSLRVWVRARPEGVPCPLVFFFRYPE